MLKIQEINIENFGPYYGKQSIKFSDQNGVTIIWGKNGFGKTTLLSCFRYAIWGKLVDRRKQIKPIYDYLNIDENKNISKSLSVELILKYDEVTYSLTRLYSRKENAQGFEPSDYEENVFLKREGSILSPHERDHFLNTILPEKTSRFYLFDGELLGEYEDLLSDNENNNIIKESIEKILGVPILENSYRQISTIKLDYERVATQAAQNENSTRNLATLIDATRSKIKQLEGSNIRLKEKVDTYRTDLLLIEESLSDSDYYKKLRDEEQNLLNQKNILESSLSEKMEDLKKLQSNAWKGVLSKYIDDIQKKFDSDYSDIERKFVENNRKKFKLEFLKIASNEPYCPICQIKIPENEKLNINIRVNEFQKDLGTHNTDMNFELPKKSNLLSKKFPNQKDEIEEFYGRIDDMKIQLSLIEANLSNKKKQKENSKFSDESFQTLLSKHSQLVLHIKNTEEGLKLNEENINDEKVSLNKLTKKLEKDSQNCDVQTALNKLEICNKILLLFEKGLDIYKQRLSEKVEKNAADLFVNISHDKSYVGLKINKNYGLEILHETGIQIPNRSAGYEQVVAISLIGALHNNSPIAGPIIMDSTFQRIDPLHKCNTLETLPMMGEQVIILAYPEEIDQERVREILGNKLMEEYTLEHPSSFMTTINKS